MEYLRARVRKRDDRNTTLTCRAWVHYRFAIELTPEHSDQLIESEIVDGYFHSPSSAARMAARNVFALSRVIGTIMYSIGRLCWSVAGPET